MDLAPEGDAASAVAAGGIDMGEAGLVARILDACHEKTGHPCLLRDGGEVGVFALAALNGIFVRLDKVQGLDTIGKLTSKEKLTNAERSALEEAYARARTSLSILGDTAVAARAFTVGDSNRAAAEVAALFGVKVPGEVKNGGTPFGVGLRAAVPMLGEMVGKALNPLSEIGGFFRSAAIPQSESRRVGVTNGAVVCRRRLYGGGDARLTQHLRFLAAPFEFSGVVNTVADVLADESHPCRGNFLGAFPAEARTELEGIGPHLRAAKEAGAPVMWDRKIKTALVRRDVDPRLKSVLWPLGETQDRYVAATVVADAPLVAEVAARVSERSAERREIVSRHRAKVGGAGMANAGLLNVDLAATICRFEAMPPSYRRDDLGSTLLSLEKGDFQFSAGVVDKNTLDEAVMALKVPGNNRNIRRRIAAALTEIVDAMLEPLYAVRASGCSFMAPEADGSGTLSAARLCGAAPGSVTDAEVREMAGEVAQAAMARLCGHTVWLGKNEEGKWIRRWVRPVDWLRSWITDIAAEALEDMR